MTRAFDRSAVATVEDGLWGFGVESYAGSVKALQVRPSSVIEARPWVARFHYSHAMPDATKEVFSAWYPGGVLAGYMAFGVGVSQAQYQRLVPDIQLGEYRELMRLWSPDGLPKNTESRFIAVATRMLRGVRLLLSFADESQGHMGGIYQAAGWTYLGMTSGGTRLVDETGQELHAKLLSVYRMRRPEFAELTSAEIARRLGWRFIPNPPKHRYAKRLDGGELRGALPYPRRKPS